LRGSPFARLAVAVLCLALCGACKLDVAVGVDAEADGGGEVRVTALLDREAARMVGDVRARLRTEDLRQAGWRVEPPERRSDGSVVVVVRRPFDDPAGAARALADLGGDHGPFKGFALQQRRTFWRTTTSLRGNVDLARGVESFADAELTERLGGPGAFGVPVEQLERRLSAPFSQLLGLQVAVKLPGRVESNAPTTAAGAAVWAPALGDRASLQASAVQWNMRNLALAGASVAFAVAAVVSGLRRRRS
jgi:hypothetical protein